MTSNRFIRNRLRKEYLSGLEIALSSRNANGERERQKKKESISRDIFYFDWRRRVSLEFQAEFD